MSCACRSIPRCDDETLISSSVARRLGDREDDMADVWGQGGIGVVVAGQAGVGGGEA